MWKLIANCLLIFAGAKWFTSLAKKAGEELVKEVGKKDAPCVSDLPIYEDKRISVEQVSLTEERVKENFAFVIDCYDHAKREGQNVLQWLFGAIVGGLGLVGALVKEDYWAIAIGAFVAVIWAAITAAKLVDALKSNDIEPPGNNATNFGTMAVKGLSATRMRWCESLGLSESAEKNLELVKQIATGTDKARVGMAYIPVWFLAFTIAAWEVEWLLRAANCCLSLLQKGYTTGVFNRILDYLNL